MTRALSSVSKKRKPRKKRLTKDELLEEIEWHLLSLIDNSDDSSGISIKRYVPDIARRILISENYELKLGTAGRPIDSRMASISMACCGAYWFFTGRRPSLTVSDGRAGGRCLDFIREMYFLLKVDEQRTSGQDRKPIPKSPEAQIRRLKQTMRALEKAYCQAQIEAGSAQPTPINALHLIDGAFLFGRKIRG